MTIKDDFLAVLAEELGPAAGPFLDRQSIRHLNKNASELQKEDVGELARWCVAGIQTALGAQVAEKVRKSLLTLTLK